MTSKRWAIIFFISLALNIFLAAVIGAGIWKSKERQAFRGPPVYSTPWAGRVLGDEVREKSRAIMRQRRAAISESRLQFRELHEAAQAALVAQPYDRAALEKALADLRAHSQQAQSGMHGNLATLSEQLTDAQREELSANVGRMIERRAERFRRFRERRQRRERDGN